MKGKPSCFKRIAIGCGGVLCLFALFVGLAAIALKTHEPKAPEMTVLDTAERFSEASAVTGIPVMQTKPLFLKLDFAGANVQVIPGGDNGQVEIEGNYDQANYELISKRREYDDHISYDVTFVNKRSILISLLSNNSTNFLGNQLYVKLPTNVLMDIQLKAELGRFDVDLGGLAVRKLVTETTKGDFMLSCSQPNQTRLEQMSFDSSMGTFRVNDIQNFRFDKADFDARYGDLTLSNSGDFERDTVDLHMSMMFGNARVELPRSARVSSNATHTLGGARGEGKTPYKTEVNLNGGVTLGEHTITYRTRKPLITRLMQRLFREFDHPQEVIAEVRRLYLENPEAYDFGEAALNTFGYSLLQRNHIDAAIEVFKFNIEIHPDYANGYDSLGEGYMVGGNKELAISNYERSLELNPHNYNGKVQLRKLRGEGKPRHEHQPEKPEPKKSDSEA